MRSTCKRNLALAGLLPGVLLALLSVPVSAQPATQSHPGRGFAAPYNVAHEITFEGTVQQVVTKHVLGSPAGMHLVVTGSAGTVDAHLGMLLSKSTREALHTGLPVQIVGAMQTINGKPYLLARQLMYGGKTVTVRSKTGFLVGPMLSNRKMSPKAQKAAIAIRGGVQ